MIRRRAKAKPAQPPPKRKKRRRKAQATVIVADRQNIDGVTTETSEQALTHIAQDAVVILRRELAWRAQLSTSRPGSVSMSDTISLLRLATDLGAAAKQGAEGGAQADYSRLSPEERVQLAALLLKVDYA